jgi:phytoene/squalene synthetase
MSDVADLQSGKGHKDENFPVASVLIAPAIPRAGDGLLSLCSRRRRCVAMTTASAEEKLALLEQMRASLMGESDAVPKAWRCAPSWPSAGLSPIHALDLLEAFRRDCTKLRYRDWDELIDYCRYSAMPVGRFVLDVHGESQSLWPANDALCAALQVNNHLQDCGKDYRQLNRVYIPEPLLAQAGCRRRSLAAAKASPALKGVIAGLARRNAELLEAARLFRRGSKTQGLRWKSISSRHWPTTSTPC